MNTALFFAYIIEMRQLCKIEKNDNERLSRVQTFNNTIINLFKLFYEFPNIQYNYIIHCKQF